MIAVCMYTVVFISVLSWKCTESSPWVQSSPPVKSSDCIHPPEIDRSTHSHNICSHSSTAGQLESFSVIAHSILSTLSALNKSRLHLLKLNCHHTKLAVKLCRHTNANPSITQDPCVLNALLLGKCEQAPYLIKPHTARAWAVSTGVSVP